MPTAPRKPTIASPDNEQPIPPLNLLGDFASGSLMAVLGTVLALFERERTGLGQVVDAAMVDGAALLLAAQLHDFNTGVWKGRGQANLSGVAPFYSTYHCLDGGWFAVGAIEQRFYRAFLDTIELERRPDLVDVRLEVVAQRVLQIDPLDAVAQTGHGRRLVHVPHATSSADGA